MPPSDPRIPPLLASLTPILLLPPTSTFLTTFLSTQKATTPTPSVLATAKLRLLASDITTSLSSTHQKAYLPRSIHSPSPPQHRLPDAIILQVLDVLDISRSRWSQLEALEMVERGEGTRGREVVRVVPTADGEENGTQGGEKGMCKVLLQDAKGVRVWGVTVGEVRAVGMGMGIGCKVVVRNVQVARGVLLLEAETVTVVGGRIEAAHKGWLEARKERLREGLEERAG